MLLVTAGAVLWTMLLVVAPEWSAVPKGRGVRRVAAGLTYLVGSRICHQRPERSFHRHGRALPVCGRCTGLYVAATLGLLAGVLTGRPRRWPGAATSAPSLPAAIDARAAWLAVAAVPTLLTWSLEMLGVWDPGTSFRAAAALPLGVVAGLVIATSGRGPST